MEGSEVSTFVDKSMFEAEGFTDDALMSPEITIINMTHDPLGTIAATCMMYEGKVIKDLEHVTDAERRYYFDEVFKTSLRAPLEFVDIHFLVEGVTRSHTHQEVRQRTAVFAQESMRFAVKTGPLSSNVRSGPLIGADKEASKKYNETIDKINETYHWMIANGIPAEEARGLLPHDTLTRMHHKVNLRNLTDEIGKRLCTQAQFEWRAWGESLMQAIGMYRSGYADDWQYRAIATSGIFRPICFNTGKCMFKSGADRGCTIRERVDAGRFSEIRDAEWAYDPKAAWVQ